MSNNFYCKEKSSLPSFLTLETQPKWYVLGEQLVGWLVGWLIN